VATITHRGIGDLPVLDELDRPDFGADFRWIADDLFARPYQGLMQTSWGDVVVFRNADLAALRSHPSSSHQPIDVMLESFGDVDKSGLNRLFGANTFSWLPPDHRPAKQLLMKLFTPSSVRRFHQDFTGIVRALLDAALVRGEIDFVEDFARPAVAQFWSSTLGLTAEEATTLVALAARVQSSFRLAPTAEAIAVSNSSSHEYMDLVGSAIARAAATGDYPLLSDLVAEYDAMGPLGRPEDPFAHLGSALIDGFHTLGEMFSSVVFALVDAGLQPDAKGTPVMSFATAAYQEGSRLHPSITVLPRWATDDFVYDDVLIPKGSNIQMAWLLGNRDPEVFENPNAYMLERPNRVKQYTFGGGFYVCAGRNVVQALSELVVAELAARSVTLEPAGDARWDPGSLLHELATFPLVVRQA
jgi:cytochrome P450